jgi:hypothetical protein
MTSRHKWAIVLIPAALLAAIVVPMALAWSEFPDSIATHWGFDGTPNGHMPPSVLILGVAGIFAAMWVAVWFASRRMPFETRSLIAGLAAVGGLLAAATIITADLNRGIANWTEAAEFNGLHIVLVFAIAIALGAVGWWLAGAPNGTANETAGAVGPVAQLDPGVSPVWSGRGRGTVLVIIGLVMVGIAIAIWSAVSLFLLLITIPVLLFSEVRATVSERGVVVSLGWLGIPSWLVPLSAISGAEVEEVSPLAYGGWGYRVRPGVRGVIVRGGPSLRLHRNDRPDLVLTVEDAERGAGVLNALLART